MPGVLLEGDCVKPCPGQARCTAQGLPFLSPPSEHRAASGCRFLLSTVSVHPASHRHLCPAHPLSVKHKHRTQLLSVCVHVLCVHALCRHVPICVHMCACMSVCVHVCTHVQIWNRSSVLPTTLKPAAWNLPRAADTRGQSPAPCPHRNLSQAS